MPDQPTIPTKRCSKCSTYYPATFDHFYRKPTTVYDDGLSWWCRGCTKRSNDAWKVRNPGHMAAYKRDYRARIFVDVLSRYGGTPPRCICCGEHRPLFLGIDHIEGGGREHRKQVGNGVKFYRWLQNQGYPDGYRVMCINCNQGRWRNGGTCPHEEERANALHQAAGA